MDDEEYYLNQIPKPRRSRLQPRKISRAVNDLMAKHGIAAERASENIQKLWLESVGELLASETRIGKLSRGSLHISVRNSLVAQELQMRKRDILQKLKTDPTLAGLKDLKFVFEYGT